MSGCEYTFILLLFAIFSLWYKDQRDNYRATRIETRSKIDRLELLFESLSAATNAYYVGGNTSATDAEIIIHRALDSSYRNLEEIAGYANGIDLCGDFCIIFDLITGGDFESNKFQQGQQHAELCKNIATQTGMLISKLNKWFNREFKRK